METTEPTTSKPRGAGERLLPCASPPADFTRCSDVERLGKSFWCDTCKRLDTVAAAIAKVPHFIPYNEVYCEPVEPTNTLHKAKTCAELGGQCVFSEGR